MRSASCRPGGRWCSTRSAGRSGSASPSCSPRTAGRRRSSPRTRSPAPSWRSPATSPRPTHGCSGRACAASCAACSVRSPTTTCVLEDRWTGEQRTVECALLVHCGHRLPEETLYLRRPGTRRAGDCVAPRTVLEAVLEARRVALAIGVADEQAASVAGRALTRPDRRRPMSATSRYRYLFSPLRIGPVVVRNRIVFSAHLTNFAEDGLPSQQHADYYAARAAGGVGLIITEEHSTHPDRLALREADPRLPPGGHPRLPEDHRGGARARGADLRAAEPQRRPGLVDVLPAARLGAQSRCRTRCSARCPRRWSGTRSPRSSPATVPSPGTARRAGSTASSCSARTPRSCADSCRPRRTSAPTPTAGRCGTGRGSCWRSSIPCATRSGPTARWACGSAATS